MSKDENELYKINDDSRNLRGQKTREEIIDQSIHYLNEVGVESFNARTLGQYMGKGRAHIRYYFKSKEELIEAIFQKIAVTTQEAIIHEIKKEKDPESQILSIVDAFFDWHKNYPQHVTVLLLFYYYCRLYPEWLELNKKIRATGRKRIEILLKQMFPQKDEKSLRSHAEFIQYYISGVLLDLFISKNTKNASSAMKKKLKKDIQYSFKNLF